MTRRRLAAQDGFVMGTAMLLLMIMMGVGLTVVAFADTQQGQAGFERKRESAFQITEGALQAQILQLGRAWPDATAPAPACTPTSPVSAACPDAATMTASYTGPDYTTATCPAGTPGAPWATTVRDNGGGAEQFYSRAITDGPPGQPAYDANLDGKVWVRATGVARCRVQDVVALVAQNLVPQPFPQNMISANWFWIQNGGPSGVVDAQSQYDPQPGQMSLRCASPVHTPCADYRASKNQVSPAALTVPPTPSPTVSPTQLTSFKRQAQAAGTFYATGCPSLRGRPSGVIYIQQPTAGCRIDGGFTQADPGILVVERGALSLGGNDVFYGLMYFANTTNLSGAVLDMQGTASVVGAVVIDGAGGLQVQGSAAQIVYDPRVFGRVKGHAGAGIVQNSWRLLPSGL